MNIGAGINGRAFSGDEIKPGAKIEVINEDQGGGLDADGEPGKRMAGEISADHGRQSVENAPDHE